LLPLLLLLTLTNEERKFHKKYERKSFIGEKVRNREVEIVGNFLISLKEIFVDFYCSFS
jgi:hypothetical protein